MLGKSTAQTALHFGANDLDGTITDGGELTEAYAVENGKVKCPNKNSSK
jgi:aminodeoxyfutalosine synthase